jgi:NADH:ubiquinone oxidoreductase subunit C
MFLVPFKYFNIFSLYMHFHIKPNSLSFNYYTNFLTVSVLSPIFHFLIKVFKSNSFFQLSGLLDIAVCDYTNVVNRFGVTYLFYSPVFSVRFYMRILADTFSFVKSLSFLFYSATWLEREVYDMFGLFFWGNLDLRRLLMDYGFNGFPLQKDFPLVGFVEKQYILSESMILSRPVVFVQEFRFTL